MGKTVLIGIVGVWLIAVVLVLTASLCGCNATQEQLDMRVEQVKVITDGLVDAGVTGQAVFLLEEQPMQIGLFEGVHIQSPIRLKAIVVVSLDPPQQPTQPTQPAP